jgi:predicted HNH restriction endonuclease
MDTTVAWADDEEDAESEQLPVQIKIVGDLEGKRQKRMSTSLSRSDQLAVLKREHAKANGGMRCETCGVSKSPVYGLVDRCFEVHHKRELAKGERITEMSDLALLCANCHAAIHGLGKTWKEFSRLFASAPSNSNGD